ncbi:MAG: hypothetical protein QW664_05420, partial [Thermoplasmata archaeon]
NTRFEAMNARFEALQKETSARFEALLKEMNARFEAMNARFEAMNARFEALEKRLNFIQWFIGAGFIILSILISLYKFF